MTPDPKWLDLIRASGWKTAAISAGCWVLLWAIKAKLLIAGPTWTLAIAAGGILCAFLTLSSLLSGVFQILKPIEWFSGWQRRSRFKRMVRDYIPHMTEHERAILAYLLHHNQKMFTAASDGGYAATLISRGIVHHGLRAGQVFDPEDVPFAVHDLAWPILHAHRDAFPYSGSDAHPWRVHWMAR